MPTEKSVEQLERLYNKVESKAISQELWNKILKGQLGDQGIGVIAERDTIRIGIQAKCYPGPVGNGAVQEVLSGVKFYNLDKGFVVTNSYFTQSAHDLAKASRVTLWDRDILNELIRKYCK